jgi:hypothetical protein
VFPGVHLDTTPSLEAVPVSRHDALTLVASHGFAPRTVELRPDGSVVRRARVSAGLYPVADCPVRELEPADAATVMKLRALETPSAMVGAATSSDTETFFGRTMRDCPAIEGGYTSPDIRVPSDVRWIVYIVRSPTHRPTAEPTRSIWIDSGGRFRAQLDVSPVEGTFDAAAVRRLDRAITIAHETAWSSSYRNDAGDCLATMEVVRIDRSGARHAGRPTDVACDAAAAPPDVRAVANAASALLSRALP